MKFKIALIITLCLSIMSYMGAQSGIGTSGNAYIHSSSEIGLHGDLIFNNNGAGTYPGIIITNRNSDNPGAVAFGKAASWKNAGDDQHVDGFVRVYSNQAFTFPVGNLGYFKPVSISGGYGTMAAYYFDNPLKLPYINSEVKTRASSSQISTEESVKVSEVEYWDVRGDQPTELTLYWDTNSDIGQLTKENLTALTIVGWKGSSWEIISSSVDDYMIDVTNSAAISSNGTSDIYGGSITTETIIPDDYDVFTFAVVSTTANEGDIEFGSELSDNERIELTVFPNPTTDLSLLNIDYDISDVKSDAYLVIYDALGENIFKQQLTQAKAIFQLPSNTEGSSGMYHIGIATEKGSKVFKPVVITK